MNNWMIYGATGYTGELIAKEAKARGLKPIIAGRSRDKVESLASSLSLPSCVFDISDQKAVEAALGDVDLILNCAGPFSKTVAPMIAACLKTKTHYLDITGEISVFEYAHDQHDKAVQAGILLCPGVGFDVIPTDCVAAKLKQALPDATHLTLGFESSSAISPGTAKTGVEGLASGGKVRMNGQIKTVPLAWKTRQIDFGRGEKLATTFPWGDVSTAYYTTNIPNIEVYVPASKKRIATLRKLNYIRWLLGLGFIQRYLKKKAGEQRGPNAEQLQNQVTYIWGEAKNAKGESKVIRLVTANGYALTVTGSLAMVDYLLNNKAKAGFATPSQLMGSDLIDRLPGSR